MNPRIAIEKEEVLSDNWYVLKKLTYRYQRSDGTWETQVREAYDRGNGAAILLYDPDRGTVVLTRQFRMPTYLNGNESGMLIEACAGLLDGQAPDDCIRREAEEETGYRVRNVRKLGEAYMSPGSVTEILHLYAAQYAPHMQTGSGGGLAEEQENIEVLELPFAAALAMIESGEIRDAKTIMLLQYAQLQGLLDGPAAKVQQILVAGPYRSNTGDDPERIDANLRAMNETALRVYELGHLPLLGEWAALPLMETAGSQTRGDAIWDRMFHPSALRLLSCCDAVLRIGGPSEGADEMVRAAEAAGKSVYRSLGEIPAVG
ncbi:MULTISPECIES: GDP-mannose pyrophosphatase NudK [Paenibacillus]|uniref:GDP-mannose pyrophosphatase NudK n=1 Tax=Paenibacillus TaxID=44249 RepID=UPI0022B8E513|nr:GDP-mannose pyrophosphatase NudK [Paenibacillus caseinilyticus]MCZ8522657.1 GDP-mannose pyrophosphatase NudK [Paenibacillus caseinilyticus]